MGKSTISMAIFNSFLYVHQRVSNEKSQSSDPRIGFHFRSGHQQRPQQVLRFNGQCPAVAQARHAQRGIADAPVGVGWAGGLRTHSEWVAVGKNQKHGIWPAKNTKKHQKTHGISHDSTDFTIGKMGSSGANIEIQPGEIRIEGGKYGTKATNIRIEPAKMVVEAIK